MELNNADILKDIKENKEWFKKQYSKKERKEILRLLSPVYPCCCDCLDCYEFRHCHNKSTGCGLSKLKKNSKII